MIAVNISAVFPLYYTKPMSCGVSGDLPCNILG